MWFNSSYYVFHIWLIGTAGFKSYLIHIIDYVLYTNAEEERRKREEAERKAKLDAIAEKQRQREKELEEREQTRRNEQIFRGSEAARAQEAAPVAQPPREPAAAPVAAAAAAAPTPGKFVPKFRLRGDSSSSAGGSQRPDARAREDDRWGSREERSRPDVRPLRQDAPPARQDAPPARPDGPPAATDRWRGSRSSANSSSSSSTWGRPRN